MANFGTCSVDEADKILIRRFKGALFPNAEGQEFKSSVSLTGGELKLSGTNPLSGEKTDVVYKR